MSDFLIILLAIAFATFVTVFFLPLPDLYRLTRHRADKAEWKAKAQHIAISPSLLSRMGMTVDEAREYAKTPGAVWVAEPGEIKFL